MTFYGANQWISMNFIRRPSWIQRDCSSLFSNHKAIFLCAESTVSEPWMVSRPTWINVFQEILHDGRMVLILSPILLIFLSENIRIKHQICHCHTRSCTTMCASIQKTSDLYKKYLSSCAKNIKSRHDDWCICKIK